jgi:hypothetical protein
MTTQLCQCGCGQPAPIATMTSRADGVVKGEPQRFARGHYAKTLRRLAGYKQMFDGGKAREVHVVTAERALGRKLPRGAQVHHVDGNKHNNEPSNLVICQDYRYHKLLHARAVIVKAGGDPNTQKVCRECREVKALADFHRAANNGVNGRSGWCKACQRAHDRRRHGSLKTVIRSVSDEMQLTRG